MTPADVRGRSNRRNERSDLGQNVRAGVLSDAVRGLEVRRGRQVTSADVTKPDGRLRRHCRRVGLAKQVKGWMPIEDRRGASSSVLPEQANAPMIGRDDVRMCAIVHGRRPVLRSEVKDDPKTAPLCNRVHALNA